MIEVLESCYRAEECRFRTIFGELEGYRVQAGRDVAEKIGLQTRYAAELYNVDVRQDQRYMAERSYLELRQDQPQGGRLDTRGLDAHRHCQELRPSGERP